MGNLAYEEEARTELIDGEPVLMSPPPAMKHNFISSNIYHAFESYLRHKKCVPVADGSEVYLSEGNRFIPDFMIVCDPGKFKTDGVHGAPDLVVEVLSPSTSNNDYGKKMDAYEKAGVWEYWIVSPGEKFVGVYILRDGRFRLDNVYHVYPEWMLAGMTGDDRAKIVTEIKCSLFDDFTISLEDIFWRVDLIKE